MATCAPALDIAVTNSLRSKLSIEGVRAVFVVPAGQGFEVHTVLSNFDRDELRHAVYAIQRAVRKEFRGVGFEFRVHDVPSDRPLYEYVTGANLVFEAA
jgi:hypothetical protein